MLGKPHGREVAADDRPWERLDALRLGERDRRLFDEVRHVAKRLLDVLAAAILLAVAAPVLLSVAVAVKVTSRGPVIFIQERAGSRRVAHRGRVWWEPRVFRCYKFRSMRVGGGDAVHRRHIERFVSGGLTDNSSVKMSADPRITAVGRLLRRTSLDELPQLVNVLRGDMSLVGPRPVPLYEVAEYDGWHYERLAARPGITGIWQVYGRGRVGFTEMIQMDIDYVRRPSLVSDLKLLALTLPAVVAGRGAR